MTDPTRHAPPCQRVTQATAALANAWPSDAAAVRRALDAGADPNARPGGGRRSVFLSQVARLSPALLGHFVQAGADVHATDAIDGDGALHALTSTFQDTSEQVALLLDAGADPNLRNRVGRTPVYQAAQFGPAPVLALLLARGGDPNVSTEHGANAAHAAAHDAARLLMVLRAGADPNAHGLRGETPVHAAASRDNLDGLELLAAAGAALDARRGGDGQTALHACVLRGAAKTAAKLVALGARVDVADDAGATPLAMALHRRDEALVAALGGAAGRATLAATAAEASAQEAALQCEVRELLRSGGYLFFHQTPGYKYEADDDHVVSWADGRWLYRYVDGYHGHEAVTALDEPAVWEKLRRFVELPGDSPAEAWRRVRAALKVVR